VTDWHICYADVDFLVDLVVGRELQEDDLECSGIEDLMLVVTLLRRVL